MGYEGPHKTVLVVDDVANNRVLLVSLLGSLGFHTIEAASGEEMLAKAQHARPDIIITDVVMRGTDGLEATQHLRKLPDWDASTNRLLTSSRHWPISSSPGPSWSSSTRTGMTDPTRDKLSVSRMYTHLFKAM